MTVSKVGKNSLRNVRIEAGCMVKRTEEMKEKLSASCQGIAVTVQPVLTPYSLFPDKAELSFLP
jgi:hypothetical protein